MEAPQPHPKEYREAILLILDRQRVGNPAGKEPEALWVEAHIIQRRLSDSFHMSLPQVRAGMLEALSMLLTLKKIEKSDGCYQIADLRPLIEEAILEALQDGEKDAGELQEAIMAQLEVPEIAYVKAMGGLTDREAVVIPRPNVVALNDAKIEWVDVELKPSEWYCATMMKKFGTWMQGGCDGDRPPLVPDMLPIFETRSGFVVIEGVKRKASIPFKAKLRNPQGACVLAIPKKGGVLQTLTVLLAERALDESGKVL